ncbi:MAG TPA: Hsp20/alpha crystallin family protein [Candidatus Hydrogenedentes bacterium]|nr:Hsp20/alpha crystallin family protein [Candidatus Hydrogenedentota bacterium]HOK90958.1 Hsp20/alpha crystallin family protein [Candidatus Hydrogenedentota bacterium]
MRNFWDPFREFEALYREMEQLFDQVNPVRRIFGRITDGPLSASYPLMNVGEDKDNVYVEVLAPGLNPESIEVTVLNDQLRIAGEKAPLKTDIKPEAFYRCERGSGRFVRTLTLPVEVESDKVTADYKNGILLVTLPKQAASKPKQIAVKVN